MGRGKGVRASSLTSIQVEFRYRGVRCREKLRLAPTPTNTRFAQRLKSAIELEICAGTFDYAKHFPRSRKARQFARRPAEVVTIVEFLNEWLGTVERTLEPETFADYSEYCRRTWTDEFKSEALSALTLARVQKWIGEQPTSRKRILNLLTPLRQAVRYAVNVAKILPVDPLANLTVGRPETVSEDKIDPFTPAEISAIVAHLPPSAANAATFWVWTGLRFGELVALTWSDVDLDGGVARVTKALRGDRTKAPKTRAGRREIRILPPAAAALTAQKAHTRLIGKEVFLNPAYRGRNGKLEPRAGRWTDKAFRSVWKAACTAAGVRYRFPRQCRHTFASWMLSAGEPPVWVARQLGHADWSMIVKVYGRWIPSVDPEAGMKGYRAVVEAGKK